MAREDGISVTPAGVLRLVVDDVEYLLRRPKVGQMRYLEESIRAIGEAQRVELEAAAAEERDPRSFDGDLLGWLRDVVRTLDRNGRELPESDDDLPSWMLNARLAADIRIHWQTVPWAAGANPTDRLTSAVRQATTPTV